jgi:hypothetical protein
MGARRKSRVLLDDRTEAMSEAALRCRADGHPWTRVLDPIEVVRKLKRQGVIEKRYVCPICTSTKTITLNAYNLQRVGEPAIKYKDPTYLIKNNDGRGRLLRADAEAAELVRAYPGLF